MIWNHLITYTFFSSAIFWNKQARVNFSKTNKSFVHFVVHKATLCVVHKAKEFVGFRTLFSHFFVYLDVPKLLRN